MTLKMLTLRASTIAAMSVALSFAVSPVARAQDSATSVTRTERVSAKVTIQSVDPTTRHLVVKKESGETVSLKVPEEVRNLDQLKPGDTITATYYRETELMIAPPGKPLPEDANTTVTARAANGELPAGLIANRLVVTGAVVGIDMANYSLKVVSPQGGAVHDIAVSSPEGRKAMGLLKVGDKITAYITEGLLISADRG